MLTYPQGTSTRPEEIGPSKFLFCRAMALKEFQKIAIDEGQFSGLHHPITFRQIRPGKWL